jgi:hypothetical protein
MMKTGISRRAVMRGIGQSAAIGSLAAVLPRMLRAAETAAPAVVPAPAAAPATPSYCLTMLYPSGKDPSGMELKFDVDAFRDRHLLTLKGAYVDSVERVELRASPVPPPPAEGAQPLPQPPLLAVVNMWIRDTTKFAENLKAHGAEVTADMATITNSQPFGQLDQVIAGLGEERATVAVDSSCLSFYYQAKETKDKVAATFDEKGFASVYLPKLYQAVGSEAIQRIEIVKGAAAVAGGKLAMLGAAHIYIGDEKKFEEAFSTDAVKLIEAEAAMYSNAPPFQTYMFVRSAF